MNACEAARPNSMILDLITVSLLCYVRHREIEGTTYSGFVAVYIPDLAYAVPNAVESGLVELALPISRMMVKTTEKGRRIAEEVGRVNL